MHMMIPTPHCTAAAAFCKYTQGRSLSALLSCTSSGGVPGRRPKYCPHFKQTRRDMCLCVSEDLASVRVPFVSIRRPSVRPPPVLYRYRYHTSTEQRVVNSCNGAAGIAIFIYRFTLPTRHLHLRRTQPSHRTYPVIHSQSMFSLLKNQEQTVTRAKSAKTWAKQPPPPPSPFKTEKFKEQTNCITTAGSSNRATVPAAGPTASFRPLLPLG